MYTRKYFVFLVLLVVVATAAAHGHALWDGLFLDDHWHQRRLAENDWSLSALMSATTIIPARFMGMWWQDQPVEWWYIRPFALLVAKLTFFVSGGSVMALHAIGLLLHVVSALMVHHLCLRMTRRRFWSIVAALLFVVYSHSVYAVSWLAAQNAILQTTLTLAALLCYLRASGLDVYAAPRELDAPDLQTARVPPLRLGWFAGCVLLWILGLLSRETAILLPVFMVMFDVAFGGGRHWRRRWPAYALMAAGAAAFMLWRVVFFHHPMPDFYFRRPDGVEYLFWWLAKFLHCFTAVVWLSPMTVGPTGRFNPFTEAPGDCALMIGILAVMGVGYYMACRRVRGYWIWPTWIILSLLPVVPIMATPHNGHLPSVGFAIGMAIGPALRDRTRPVSVGRWVPGVAIWFLIATTTYVPIYRPMWYSMLAAERLTVHQVLKSPPPAEAREIFFINLPFVNIYARYHLDEALGHDIRPIADRVMPEPPFHTHALTFAPDLLRMSEPCRLEQLDAHRFRLTTSGRGYFSSTLGRFFIEAMRRGARRFEAGEVVCGELFDVTILRADAGGVRELEFRFHKPLASPEYCFYITTRQCEAARVLFEPTWTAGATPVEPRQVVSSDPDPQVDKLRWQRGALYRIRGIASRVIRTDLYLTGPPFPDPR